MHINYLSPSAYRLILLGCCFTPPFFSSVCAQNSGEFATTQTEVSVKKGFVEGKVLDNGDHEPMIGVTVAIEGTTNAVTTDIDGNFSLPIKGECNIVFSFIGYKKLVVRYTGNNQADFARILMKTEALNIKDVVVTGVYRRKKESFTGSSSTFKGAIYENIVGDMLVKQGYNLYFYRNEKSTIEMDFFIRDAQSLIPVEVKATDNATRSLAKLTAQDGKYPDIRYGIKLCNKNIGFNGKFYTFPYFLTFLLKRFVKRER